MQALSGSAEESGRLRGLALTTCLLLLGFSRPLVDLGQFALSSELYSYILLVPVISLYLAWVKRSVLPHPAAPAHGLVWIFLAGGLAALAGYWQAAVTGASPVLEDQLALISFSFVMFFFGACAWFLGRPRFLALAFPLGFLAFLVPIPLFVEHSVERFLQLGSAATAYAFFKISGMSVFYHDLIFQLPGFSLQIAPECSGIHSSLVLLITGLLAGHLFLRTPWKRAVLAVAVVPLALLRNGFRVFTIGELCVHVGPEMINSPIHRKGGPLFFALSLVPFFALLFLLSKSDRRRIETKLVTGGT